MLRLNVDLKCLICFPNDAWRSLGHETYKWGLRTLHVWARVMQTWLSEDLFFPFFTFLLHAHAVNVLPCLRNPTGALLTSPLLLLSPSSPLFCSSYSFPSSSTEGWDNLSLTSLSLPNDGQLSDGADLFFFLTCDQEDYPVVTSTLVFSGQKMATKEVTVREVGARLMMLPKDVLEVCRDVNRSHSRTLLPSSLLLSRCLYRAPFWARAKPLWDRGHFSMISPFSSSLSSGVLVCSNY